MSLDKRIIEHTASTELYDDDFIVKDSALHGTTKMSKSSLLGAISNTLGMDTINEHLEQVDDAVENLTDDKASYTMFATKWTALTTYFKDQVVIYNGELYRAKDTNVSPTFNPSAWTKISFDTLYRTTLANVKNSICEEWSTSGEYTLNDCAIYEDKLYKCVADTATVGTWVSSEWELVSIYEIIQNLPKSASDVTYDNTDSGLEADNVQDALDEVAETITELSNTTEVTGTASGAIATFTDGADAPLKELKVAVTPYQDLHGYDAPWAGGAGKNLLDLESWLDSCGSPYTKNGDEYEVTTTGLLYSQPFVFSDVDIEVTLSGALLTNVTTTNFRIDWLNANDAVVDSIYAGQPVPRTVTASKMRFNWSSPGSFRVSKLQIEKGSTATSFAPYSNICPIIGWNEAVVTRCGKNLFGGLTLGNAIVEAVNNPSNTYLGTDADGNYVTFLAGIAIRDKNFSSNLKFKEKTRYSFVLALKRDTSSSQAVSTNIQVTYTDGTIVHILFPSQPTLGVKTTFVFTTATDKTVKEFSLGYYSGRIYMYYEECGIFEGEITTDDFAPYNGATYTIDLDGTRYGGVLDATNGTLTVDRTYVDLGTLNPYTPSTGVFAIHVDCPTDGQVISDYYKTVNVINPANLGNCEITTTNYIGNYYPIVMRNNDYTDTASFKQAMSGVQLVYELATPITVQLSPTQVKSLEGTNNIFANCGDINNVEYVRNLNITINDLLSRING